MSKRRESLNSKFKVRFNILFILLGILLHILIYDYSICAELNIMGRKILQKTYVCITQIILNVFFFSIALAFFKVQPTIEHL